MSYIKDILADFGEDITVRSISKTLSEWGDATETVTTYTVNMEVQIMSNDDQDVEEGRLQGGDIVCYADPEGTNAEYLVLNNEITYLGNNYRIMDVIREPALPTGEYHLEIHARKV